MKAILIRDYGGPEVLQAEEIDRPQPAAGEVLVHVHAAGVNPVDWKIRGGFARAYMDPPMPLTLGTEIAGTVVAAGEGADRFAIGDAVFGMIGMWGAYAEYVAVAEALLAPKPEVLDFAAAASVPLSALTAWAALIDIANVSPGQRVLIHAAGGGVGSMAVQIAKFRGAYVIGTASSASADRVRALGADEVVCYDRTAFEQAVGNVDLVLDLMGGEVERRSWGILKPGGLLIAATAPPDSAAADAAGVRVAFVAVAPDGAALAEIAALIDQGTLRVADPIGFALDDAAEAHRLCETGHAPARIVLALPS